MKLRSFRSFWLGIIPLALTACGNPGPAAADQQADATPLGVDLGASGPAAAASRQPQARPRGLLTGVGHAMPPQGMGDMQMAHADHAQAQGIGTVNSVDAAARKVNVSHGPISALGWPGMTMDFAVAPSVDLHALKPGVRVNFTIEHGEGDAYVIQSVAPAGGGR